MSGVALHHCGQTDEMGAEVVPEVAACGVCHRAWCFRCDPAPSALCHYCHGRGASLAPVPPRQARLLFAQHGAVFATR